MGSGAHARAGGRAGQGQMVRGGAPATTTRTTRLPAGGNPAGGQKYDELQRPGIIRHVHHEVPPLECRTQGQRAQALMHAQARQVHAPADLCRASFVGRFSAGPWSCKAGTGSTVRCASASEVDARVGGWCWGGERGTISGPAGSACARPARRGSMRLPCTKRSAALLHHAVQLFSCETHSVRTPKSTEISF